MAEQLLFEALMEPSLHRKVSPSHPAIPPFLPEHGWLAADAVEAANNSIAIRQKVEKGIQPRRVSARTSKSSYKSWPYDINVYRILRALFFAQKQPQSLLPRST